MAAREGPGGEAAGFVTAGQLSVLYCKRATRREGASYGARFVHCLTRLRAFHPLAIAIGSARDNHPAAPSAPLLVLSASSAAMGKLVRLEIYSASPAYTRAMAAPG